MEGRGGGGSANKNFQNLMHPCTMHNNVAMTHPHMLIKYAIMHACLFTGEVFQHVHVHSYELILLSIRPEQFNYLVLGFFMKIKE